MLTKEVLSGMHIFFIYFLSLQQKVTKNASEFDAGQTLRSKIFSDELAFGRAYYAKGLRFKTPLRAVMPFLEALYFSPHAYSHLMPVQVKNKALEQSLNSK